MQTLIFGLEVTVLGVVIVFIALTFLIYLIKVMTKLTKVSEKKANTPESISAKQETVFSGEPAVLENNEEIVAVIAAAVASVTQGKMKIKTIKRIQDEKTSAWSRMGRQETMFLRQFN